MAEASSFEAKFHNEINQFITAKDKITADELEEYMKKCILNGEFQPNTKFVLMAGFNHTKDKDGKVILGVTDFSLLEDFEHKLFSNLYEIKDPAGDLIWDKMNFDDELVTLATYENLDMKTFVPSYHLSDLSMRKLMQLAKVMKKETRPICIIFASSYSHESSTIEFMVKEGVFDALEGTDVHEGFHEESSTSTNQTCFELDEKSRKC